MLRGRVMQLLCDPLTLMLLHSDQLVREILCPLLQQFALGYVCDHSEEAWGAIALESRIDLQPPLLPLCPPDANRGAQATARLARRFQRRIELRCVVRVEIRANELLPR